MKRLRLIAILLAALLLGLLALLYARGREPRYQGRALTQWLEDYRYASFDSPRETDSPAVVEAATKAVRQIGTNAIPFLLKKITAKDNFLERGLKSLVGKQSLVRFGFESRAPENLLGWDGFAILGEDAASAAPALVELTKNPDADLRFTALNCLMCLKPKRELFVPILLHGMQDSDKGVQIGSISILSKLYPEEAEKAGVYKKYPKLRRAPAADGTNNAPVVR